jgi:hypothetical protein
MCCGRLESGGGSDELAVEFVAKIRSIQPSIHQAVNSSKRPCRPVSPRPLVFLISQTSASPRIIDGALLPPHQKKPAHTIAVRRSPACDSAVLFWSFIPPTFWTLFYLQALVSPVPVPSPPPPLAFSTFLQQPFLVGKATSIPIFFVRQIPISLFTF